MGDGKFKKGQSGNPLGGKLHSPVKRQFKKLTEEQLREVMNLIIMVEPEKLTAEVNKNPSVLKLWIAKVAEKGMLNGDLGPLLSILDRVVGKVKEPPQEIVHKTEMTDEELREEIARYRAINEAKGS